VVGVLGLVVAMTGCDALPFGFTSIKDIAANPAQFEGKVVKLQGRVSGVAHLPFVELKAYSLRDDTGEITILTQAELPTEEAQVGVRGTVKSAAIFGGSSLDLRVEEVSRF
jgi:hypothetical protein